MTALAKAVGVCPSYLSKLFQGVGNPSIPLAQKLAEKMGLTMEGLMRELGAAQEKRAMEKGLERAHDQVFGTDGGLGLDGKGNDKAKAKAKAKPKKSKAN